MVKVRLPWGLQRLVPSSGILSCAPCVERVFKCLLNCCKARDKPAHGRSLVHLRARHSKEQ